MTEPYEYRDKRAPRGVERLVVNGVEVYGTISIFYPPNRNGLWEFVMDDGRHVLATGNVLFICTGYDYE